MTPQVLDNNTTELLIELQRDYNISFVTKNIDYSELFQKGNNVTIYYNPKIINTESITHELLHIWLTKFNYSIGNYLFLCTEDDKKLNKFLTKFLCDYIGNCCDHLKMYPKYLEMGYSPKEFLKNGLELKTSLKDIKKLRLKFIGIYNGNNINLFIGYLISILADHIKENDYTEHHKYLMAMNSVLYQVIVDFWSKWEVFDIENIDAIYNSDLELMDNFIDELKAWANDKTII